MLAIKKNKNKKGLIKIDPAEEAESAIALLLVSLSLGSIMVSGSVQPGIFSLFESRQGSEKFTKIQWKNAYYNSKRRKLIEVVKMKDGRVKVKLTNKGITRTKEFPFENLKIKKPFRWDKKWRILIFDIPSKPAVYNQARNALRKKIKELGFYQMQKSVWVYPYECEDEILLIAEIYKVQKYIEIITAEKILHENIVRRAFNF